MRNHVKNVVFAQSRAVQRSLRCFGFQRPRALPKAERSVAAPSGSGEVYAASAGELAAIAYKTAKKHSICSESRALWRDIEFQAIALADDLTIKDVVQLSEALAFARVRNKELLQRLAQRWRNVSFGNDDTLLTSRFFHAFDQLDCTHLSFQCDDLKLEDFIGTVPVADVVGLCSYYALNNKTSTESIQQSWQRLEKSMLDDEIAISSLPTSSVIQLAQCLPLVDNASSISVVRRKTLFWQVQNRLKIIAPRLSSWEASQAFVSVSRINADGPLLDDLFKRIESFANTIVINKKLEKETKVLEMTERLNGGHGLREVVNGGLTSADVGRVLQAFGNLDIQNDEFVEKLLHTVKEDQCTSGAVLEEISRGIIKLNYKSEWWLQFLLKHNRSLLDEDLGPDKAQSLLTELKDFIR